MRNYKHAHMFENLGKMNNFQEKCRQIELVIKRQSYLNLWVT